MDPVDKLTEYFTKFPGVGIRQARRFVFHLLHKDASYRKSFADHILSIESAVAQCAACQRFTTDPLVAGLCTICRNTNRKEVLLIVEKDADLERIERSGAFRGRYFVLGGIVPMTSDNPNEHVRLRNLQSLLSARTADGLSEVVFGLSVTPDGEHTTELIHEHVLKSLDGSKVRVTRLGRGLSTGSELEYADVATIESALKTRG